LGEVLIYLLILLECLIDESSYNYPPNAKTIAKIIEKIKIAILTIFESLFVDELAINFSNK